jgi:hypothetical protein
LQEHASGRTPKYGKETRGKVKGFDQGGDLPGGIKLDEEYFGGERILHVGCIRRVRASGLRQMFGFAGIFMCRFRTRLGYVKVISQSICWKNGRYLAVISFLDESLASWFIVNRCHYVVVVKTWPTLMLEW